MQPTEKSSTDTNPNFVGKIAAPTFSLPEKIESAKVVDAPLETSEVITDYSSTMGRPYLVDVFGIHALKDHADFSEMISTVDQYIIGKIQRDGLEKTKRAYESVLDSLLKDLEVDPLTEFDKKLERLSGFITVQNAQDKLKALKRELGIDVDTD